MDNSLVVRIECKGAESIDLDEFNNLQGSLKTLLESDYVKLRNSITEYGFSFPIFYWQDEQGVKWVIDAHQRLFTLRKMKSEGWTVPPLPADPIYAKDKIEAKKKLLILQSRYGKITETGMADFLTEPGNEIEFSDISDLLSYPEGDFGSTDQSTETGSGNQDEEIKTVTCPNCNHSFTI